MDRRVLYCVIGIVIAISTYFSWQQIKQHIQNPNFRESIWEAVFCAAVIALVLALLHDLILKRMDQKEIKLDRDEFAEEFATDFFTTYTETDLVDDVLKRIIIDHRRRPVVAKALASTVIADSGSHNHDLIPRVERTYLYPVDNQPRFRDYESKSWLTDYDRQTGIYTWTCERFMKTIRTVKEYRIVLCGKSDIEFNIAQSSKAADARAADAIFTLSEFSPEIAQKWFDDLRDRFRVRATDRQQRNGSRRHGLRLEQNDGSSWPRKSDLSGLRFLPILLGHGRARE